MNEIEPKTEAEIELDNQKDKFGRKTVVTPAVIVKLEQAFALGCTDLEACFYAGIGKSTLYNYQELNPDFVERKNELKMKPVLMARQSVMRGINGHEIKDENGKVVKVILAPDPKLAFDYLKNKMHKEFKSGIDLSGEVKFDKAKRDETISKWFEPVEEEQATTTEVTVIEPVEPQEQTINHDNNDLKDNFQE